MERRVEQNRAGDRHRLPLAAGQRHAALANLKVEAVRVGAQEVADAGHVGSPQDALVVDVRRAERDVVAHRAEEQVVVLRDIADVAAQVGGIDLARSEEHTSELQSLMRISYAVFCLKKKKTSTVILTRHHVYRKCIRI